jgi:hypothetical protein
MFPKSLIISLLAANAAAIIIPANIQTFYNNVKAQGDCNNKLADNLYSYNNGPPGSCSIRFLFPLLESPPFSHPIPYLSV